VDQIKYEEKLLMAFCDLMKALYSNILSLYHKTFSDSILESRAVERKIFLVRAIFAIKTKSKRFMHFFQEIS
jgi:hypothetical protein